MENNQPYPKLPFKKTLRLEPEQSTLIFLFHSNEYKSKGTMLKAFLEIKIPKW